MLGLAFIIFHRSNRKLIYSNVNLPEVSHMYGYSLFSNGQPFSRNSKWVCFGGGRIYDSVFALFLSGVAGCNLSKPPVGGALLVSGVVPLFGPRSISRCSFNTASFEGCIILVAARESCFAILRPIRSPSVIASLGQAV
jgi:hypothetical protein